MKQIIPYIIYVLSIILAIFIRIEHGTKLFAIPLVLIILVTAFYQKNSNN